MGKVADKKKSKVKSVKNKADEQMSDDTDGTSVTKDSKKSKAKSVDKVEEQHQMSEDSETETLNKIKPRTAKKKKQLSSNDDAATSDEEVLKKKAKNGITEKSDLDSEPENDKEKANSESEVEEEYEVKNIIDHKTEKGVSLFLVRWKGYKSDSDTWEPEESLNCPDLIKAFKTEKTLKNKPKNSKESKNKQQKVDSDANAEWEVEKIIDMEMERGKRLFLVRWKGYKSKHDSWEPEKNLCCGDLKEKFLENYNKNLEFQKGLREEPKPVRRFESFDKGGRSSKRCSKRGR